MRILLANYRYFFSGGPERYMFNVSDALAQQGHEIIPFSITYDKNRPTPYARYFVKPLGRGNEVTFKEHEKTPGTVYRTLKRLFYDPGVEKAVMIMASEVRPQVAYVLHYLRKLSPALLVGLKKAGVPIVVRLSDYAMLCPEGHCFRNGSPCELCLSGDLWPSISYRCVQGSLAASIISAAATWFHRNRGFFQLIDVFVVSNSFMRKIMLRAGFPDHKVRCIPTLVNSDAFKPDPGGQKDDYIIFAGRLQEIKGVHIFIEALHRLHRDHPGAACRAKIVGSGDAGYQWQLHQLVRDRGLEKVIEFIEEVDAAEMARLLARARLSVIPSLCYDNLPNSLLESFACGTPVLASALGALADSIQPGETGHLFNPGDADDLVAKIKFCLDHPEESWRWGRQARATAVSTYSRDHHLQTLEELFRELTGGKKGLQ